MILANRAGTSFPKEGMNRDCSVQLHKVEQEFLGEEGSSVSCF